MSEIGETASGRRAAKRAAVFRTIGEVAEDLDLPAHVLRFWESKFTQLRPLKRGGGRRYYRPEDIALLSRIRQCLYQEGYTIRGVQKLLSEGTLGVLGGAVEMAPSLFPLDPLPGSAPAAQPAPRPERRAAVKAAARVEGISGDRRAKLEAAARDLLSARQILDSLLASLRKA
ncbi:MAG TPA: MerR family transcriptional regulator [Stellaceae bacterium]|nr:MerR family transcriptional regulator [Stellaceae bacterium]